MSAPVNLNNELLSVKRKVIAIIGSTGILGTEYVKYLTRQGATVIIGDVHLDKCVQLSNETVSAGFSSLPVEIDITDEQSIANFFEVINKTYGKLDVLINNAQVKAEGFYASFEDYSKETLINVLDGNLVGVTLACREAIKIFLRQGFGNIINVASIYGVVGADQRIYDDVSNIYYPDQRFSSPVSYGIAKAGVIQLTKYLASYYREKNIRVNCFTPGGVFDNHDDNFNSQYSQRTTIGRMADRLEYNGVIQFLCSDASSYMSGTNLLADGGWCAI